MRRFAALALVLMAGFAQAAPPAPSVAAAPAATADATTPAPLNCPASSSVKLIAAYGDSTTVGVGADDAAHTMPAILETLICHIKVSNEGVSGTRADQLLNGTDGKHAPWNQELKQSKAHILLFNFGINDSRQPGETIPSYSMNMHLLVDAAKAAGKTVVLETPNPIFPTQKADAPDAKLQAHAQAVRQLAKAEHVPLIDVNAAMLAAVKQHKLSELYSDPLHPTAAGYRIIAQTAVPILQPLH